MNKKKQTNQKMLRQQEILITKKSAGRELMVREIYRLKKELEGEQEQRKLERMQGNPNAPPNMQIILLRTAKVKNNRK